MHPHVLAACFDGVDECRFLAPAITDIGQLDRLEDRARLIARVVAIHPSLVILPAADAAGVATTALVERCVNQAPDVPVLVLIPVGRVMGRAISRAIHFGGYVVSVGSASELRIVVAQFLQPRPLSAGDAARLEQLLKGLEPNALANLLRDAVLVAHERIDVGRLAVLGGRSRRSISRDLNHAGWPPPRELIVWSRLLRVAVTNYGEGVGTIGLAWIGGFRSSQALLRACKNLLGIRGRLREGLGAGRVGSAFRARLERLDGRGR